MHPFTGTVLISTKYFGTAKADGNDINFTGNGP